MKADEPVSSIMATSLTVVGPEQDLATVYDMLLDRGLHHVPVVQSGRFIGLISSNDLLRVTTGGPELPGPDAVRERLSTMNARQVMTEDVITTAPDAPIRQAAEQLMSGALHGLPVVKDGDLVGMLTTTDLIRCLLEG